jgi:hypothetical protein
MSIELMLNFHRNGKESILILHTHVFPPSPQIHKTVHPDCWIWHKSYRYGTNGLKGILDSAEASQASICVLCNRVEDPSHIYSRYKHPLLRRLREATFDIQTRALARLRTDPGCPTWERSFFRKFHKRSFSHRHDRAETCWNGTLNPSDLQSLLS